MDTNQDSNQNILAETKIKKKDAQDTERRKLLTWLWRVPVLAGIFGGLWAFFKAYTVHFSKPRPSENPKYQTFPEIEISTVKDLSKAWEARAFNFAGMPSLLVRIPQATTGSIPLPNHPNDHLIALSRVCTHQGCVTVLNKNPEAIAVGFNYRGDEPAMVCPCHLSVFSVLEAGQAVSGPARLPLPRVRLELKTKNQAESVIVATGIEDITNL